MGWRDVRREWRRPRRGARAGRAVFAAVTAGANFSVVELRPDGSRVPITVAAPGRPFAMVVDASGAPYVLTYTDTVVAFNSGGSVRATYPLGGTTDGGYTRTAIDLASDQCTLFVLDLPDRLRRFNVCTGTALPDFPLPAGELYIAIRLLPDGDVLLSRDDGLARFDASGALVRTYAVGDGFDIYALMLRDGGRRVVIGEQVDPCNGRLLTVDLESGEQLSSVALRMELPTSLVTFYGWTAALGAAHPAEAPALGTIALTLLATMLAALAILWLRA